MKLEILQADIDNANRDGCATQECVVATAAKRHFETNDVECGFTTLHVGGTDFTLDDFTASQIMNWICMTPVKPWTAKLERM